VKEILEQASELIGTMRIPAARFWLPRRGEGNRLPAYTSKIFGHVPDAIISLAGAGNRIREFADRLSGHSTSLGGRTSASAGPNAVLMRIRANPSDETIKSVSLAIVSEEEVARSEETIAEGLKVLDGIEKASKDAPLFKPSNNRLRYAAAHASETFAERKKMATQHCKTLAALCSTRANEQPQVKGVVSRYQSALKSLRSDKSPYTLLLIGDELSTLVRIKSLAPPDSDRNLPLDADMLHAISTLLIAHAGLMATFPDAASILRELDQYGQQTQALDALRNRVLDPVLEVIAQAKDVLDADTAEITKQVSELGRYDKEPSQREVAVRHNWLRGILAAMGNVLLSQGPGMLKAGRDAAVKVAVEKAVEHRKALATAIGLLLWNGRDALLALASQLPTAFGWVQHLINIFIP
jgi:hypothetical protein